MAPKPYIQMSYNVPSGLVLRTRQTSGSETPGPSSGAACLPWALMDSIRVSGSHRKLKRGCRAGSPPAHPSLLGVLPGSPSRAVLVML